MLSHLRFEVGSVQARRGAWDCARGAERRRQRGSPELLCPLIPTRRREDDTLSGYAACQTPASPWCARTPLFWRPERLNTFNTNEGTAAGRIN